MNYIIFFNYEDGTREYGFYMDYEEAKEHYSIAISEAKRYSSRVEIGIAEIVETHKTYIADLI